MTFFAGYMIDVHFYDPNIFPLHSENSYVFLNFLMIYDGLTGVRLVKIL